MDFLKIEVLQGSSPETETIGFLKFAFNTLPDYWKHMIPENTSVISMNQDLTNIDLRGLCAPAVEYSKAQVLVCDECIYARFNPDIKKAPEFFQYEALCAFARAMCNGAVFMRYIDKYIEMLNVRIDNKEMFVRGFPFFVGGEKSRCSLKLKNPKLFDALSNLDNQIKYLVQIMR